MRALVIVLVLVLVAACGQAPGTIVRRPPLSIAEPMPPGMVPVPSADASAVPPECGPGGSFDPYANSLRPLVPQPKPGAMPPGSVMDEIVRRGRLIAAVDQNLNLFSSHNPRTGSLEGFDVDVVKQIAKALLGNENKVQLRAVNFTDNFAVLNSGEVDILVDSITITCERRYRHKVWFSTNYFESGQRVMVARRSPYKSVNDLGGKRVCAPVNTTSIREIRDYSAVKLVPVAVAEFSDCLVLLQQGQVEAVSSTDSVLLGMVRQDPTLHMSGDRFTREPHGIAVRERDSDMIRFVNGVLEQMRQDGTWRQLYGTWLKGLDGDGVVPNPPPAQYLAGS